MSHLIEEYAKNLGVKINQAPIMMEHVWPIPFDKYIVISTGGEAPSKTYKYFGLVLDMLSPILRQNQINIIQIGSSKDYRLENVSLRLVDISARQMAYVVSHSMLYVGSDSVWSHYASSKDTPIVTIHGNAFAAISNGCWSGKQINIEGKWENAPCFSANDPNGSVDKIKPEEIAKACCKLLNINYNNQLKTVYIGKIFGEPIVEIVPDFSPNMNPQNNHSYFLRCDFTDNNFVAAWCQHLPRFSVFVRMGTDLNILSRYKNKIDSILFEVKDGNPQTKEFVKNASKLCKNVVLLAKNQDLPKLRNKWFDYRVLPKFPEDQTDIGSSPNRFVASSKLVMDKNGSYASLFHRKVGIKDTSRLLPVAQNQEFFEELEHFVVFEKEN